jgi:hypothetical protein
VGASLGAAIFECMMEYQFLGLWFSLGLAHSFDIFSRDFSVVVCRTIAGIVA